MKTPSITSVRWLIPAALLAALLTVPLSQPTPRGLAAAGVNRYGLTDAQRRAVFEGIASRAPRWRAASRAKFSQAEWSAEDDYHWHVQYFLEHTLADQLSRDSSALWAAYDEAVHDRWRQTRRRRAQRPRQAQRPRRAQQPRRARQLRQGRPQPSRRGRVSAGSLTATVVPLQPRQR